MTVHKLSAGDGYTYLTNQVASQDTLRGPGQDLADYYLATGAPPGRWTGAGARDLGVDGPVSEQQMQALFGQGVHPDWDQIVASYVAAGRPASSGELAARLGRRFSAYSPEAARRAVAGYDLVFTPVKSVSLLWALGGDQIREQVESAHHEAVANVIEWLETNAAFSRVGKDGIERVETRGLICAAFDHRDSPACQGGLRPAARSKSAPRRARTGMISDG